MKPTTITVSVGLLVGVRANLGLGIRSNMFKGKGVIGWRM